MTLEEMRAREAIRYTISRYTSAIDRAAYEELVDVFTPDGVMMFGDTKRLEGLDSIIASMSTSAPPAHCAFRARYMSRGSKLARNVAWA